MLCHRSRECIYNGKRIVRLENINRKLRVVTFITSSVAYRFAPIRCYIFLEGFWGGGICCTRVFEGAKDSRASCVVCIFLCHVQII